MEQVEVTRARDPLFEIDGRNGVWSIPAWCAQYAEVFLDVAKIRSRLH
jgi:hypothetical protein